MRSWVAMLCAVAGCGRIAFDPLGERGADMGDGAAADGTQTSDASGACAAAIPLTVGRTAPVSTCTGSNVADFCQTGKEEVFFVFDFPPGGNYTFRSYDAGTSNQSHPLTRVSPTCMDRIGAACTPSYVLSTSQGQRVYLMVEAEATACATIELGVSGQ